MPNPVTKHFKIDHNSNIGRKLYKKIMDSTMSSMRMDVVRLVRRRTILTEVITTIELSIGEYLRR